MFPRKHSVVRLTCFPNRFQEPYILLRYSQHSLFYNEQFINYGCNKVQLIDHLRHLGYKFYLITNSFAMDIVHPEYVFAFYERIEYFADCANYCKFSIFIHSSNFRKSYINKIHDGGSPYMRLLCYHYQDQLDKMFPPSVNQTLLCEDKATYHYI